LTHFSADYDGIGEMLKADFMEAAMLERAEKVRSVAEATAPFDAKEATHFRDSFHTSSTVEGGVHHDRATATVYNDDTAAVQIELGTSKTPAHRTLTKALDAAGH
jgi:hypothetical protein